MIAVDSTAWSHQNESHSLSSTFCACQRSPGSHQLLKFSQSAPSMPTLVQCTILQGSKLPAVQGQLHLQRVVRAGIIHNCFGFYDDHSSELLLPHCLCPNFCTCCVCLQGYQFNAAQELRRPPLVV